MSAATVPTRTATRWAALGAAVAVSLGAGGFGVARATSPHGAAAFVPITPCRLFDTRPDSAVGQRTAPLGPEDTFTVTATGEQGDCNVPGGASGVVLNLTAVGATAATFLTVWPAGEVRPTASSLNPTPGSPPAPNAVTTELGDDDALSIYNRFGSVHVIADVVGYYTDHHHDDRYLTEAEVEARLAEVAAAAPAAWKPIPSGVTVTGGVTYDGSTSGSILSDATFVELPGIPPVVLTDESVNFAAAGGVSEPDPDCTGSFAAPSAPPGKVCIYLGEALRTAQFGGDVAPGTRGFLVHYNADTSTPGQNSYFEATWGYTAP